MQSLGNAPSRLARFNRQKRILDVIAVVASSPITLTVGAVVYLTTLIASGRPVFFTQRRLGYREREFTLFKFRTMTNETDSAGRSLPDAERVSKFGSFLRRSSLDELPQLINVLRGEMALIGPRPLFTDYKEFYLPHEQKRHWVRPGITGLAQTSGRNSVLWDERLQLDSEYVERASLCADFAILVRTVTKVLGSRDVAAIPGESGERLDVVRSYPTLDGFALRRLELVDIPLRVAWFNDPRIRQHMQLPEGVTLESSRNWLRNAQKDRDRRDFVVVESLTRRVFSMVGIRKRESNPLPELYILVDPDSHGKGIGHISMSLLHAWVLKDGTQSGLYLTVAEGNKPAIALYERLGYVTTGSLDAGARREMVWQPRPPSDEVKSQ